MKKSLSLLALATIVFTNIAVAIVPPDAKFAGNCAYTLASEGKAVLTDCKISWKDSHGTGTYCFSNEDAMKKWATNTNKHMQMATESYAKVQTQISMDQANAAMKNASDAMNAAMKDSTKAMDQANAAMKAQAGK